MSRKSIPSYKLHKASGQARVIIRGQSHYLGKFNSPESHRKYALLIAELSRHGFACPPSQVEPTNTAKNPILLVSELLVAYLRYARVYYSHGPKAGKEYRAMLDVAGPVTELFGHVPVDEFGPLKLKSFQQHLVQKGYCRNEVNRRTGRVKRIFKWAVSEELAHPSVHHGLQAVPGLKRGRTEARESEPVKPVELKHVEPVISAVSPQVAAIIQIQLLTGMRPSEVLGMRPIDIDQSELIWSYSIPAHKNSWRGHKRVVPLGPKAQQILKPFLDRNLESYLFSPAEAEAWRDEQRFLLRNRKTKVYLCELKRRTQRKSITARKKPKKAPGHQYDIDSYRRSIKYGIAKINRERVKLQTEEIIPSWHPYQLRHTFATRLRKQFGVEAAQLGLGHARTDIVEIYAEKNHAMLVDIMAQCG
jgi:integrase